MQKPNTTLTNYHVPCFSESEAALAVSSLFDPPADTVPMHVISRFSSVRNFPLPPTLLIEHTKFPRRALDTRANN